METHDSLSDRVSSFQAGQGTLSQEEYDAVIKDWSNLPPMSDMKSVLEVCRLFLKDHPDAQEVLSALVIFVEQMEIWQDISMGKKPSLLEMETMVTGEGIVLDMTNEWFARNKRTLDIALMECRSAMTVVRLIRTIGDSSPDKIDEEIEIVWQHFVRSWDFIPWFMFVATGSVTLYSSIKVLMCRYVIDAKPEFLKNYMKFRNAE